MHPLLGDLTKLSDDELLKKINELYDKLRKSYFFPNSDVSGQLRLILDGYNAEQNRRLLEQQKIFEKENKKYTDRIDIE